VASGKKKVFAQRCQRDSLLRLRATRHAGFARNDDAFWTGYELFGADGEDLLALDFDFYAEGRANVAALHDGAANPNVPG